MLWVLSFSLIPVRIASYGTSVKARNMSFILGPGLATLALWQAMALSDVGIRFVRTCRNADPLVLDWFRTVMTLFLRRAKETLCSMASLPLCPVWQAPFMRRVLTTVALVVPAVVARGKAVAWLEKAVTATTNGFRRHAPRGRLWWT